MAAYKPPYTYDEIVQNYGQDVAERLRHDDIHYFRMRTGIELIHQEPSREEFERIRDNWFAMSSRAQKTSDDESIRIFGMSNLEHAEMLLDKVYRTTEERFIKDFLQPFAQTIIVEKSLSNDELYFLNSNLNVHPYSGTLTPLNMNQYSSYFKEDLYDLMREKHVQYGIDGIDVEIKVQDRVDAMMDINSESLTPFVRYQLVGTMFFNTEFALCKFYEADCIEQLHMNMTINDDKDMIDKIDEYLHRKQQLSKLLDPCMPNDFQNPSFDNTIFTNDYHKDIMHL